VNPVIDPDPSRRGDVAYSTDGAQRWQLSRPPDAAQLPDYAWIYGTTATPSMWVQTTQIGGVNGVWKIFNVAPTGTWTDNTPPYQSAQGLILTMISDTQLIVTFASATGTGFICSTDSARSWKTNTC